MPMKPTPTPDDAALLERLRNLVDNQTGGDALVLVQRQLFNKVVGRLSALSAALSVPAAAVVGEPVAYLVTTVRTGEKRLQWQPVANLPYNRDRFISTPLYAAPSAPDGWQPMETAPRDRTAIILALKGGRVTVGHWLDNSKTQWPWQGWSTDAGPMTEPKVTHWRPLPSPPGEKS